MIANQGFKCPECAGTGSIETNHGITCRSCGLVVEAGKQYVVSQPLGKNGMIQTHSIITKGLTKIGLGKERITEKIKRLASTQSKSVNYYDKKKSRVYIEVSRLVSGLGLPESLTHETMHVYSTIKDQIPPGSSMANVEILSTALLFLTGKMRGCNVYLSKLLEISDIHAKRFRQNILKISRIVKEKFPDVKQDKIGSKDRVIDSAMDILREHAGVGEYSSVVESVYSFVNSHLVGMKQRSKLGIVAFVSSRLLDIDISLSDVSKRVNYTPSSLYNAIMRMLSKMGLERPKGLGNVDFKSIISNASQSRKITLEQVRPIAWDQMLDIATKLRLPLGILTDGHRIYDLVSNHMLGEISESKTKLLGASFLMMASRLYGTPINMGDLSSVSGIDTARIRKAFSILVKYINQNVPEVKTTSRLRTETYIRSSEEIFSAIAGIEPGQGLIAKIHSKLKEGLDTMKKPTFTATLSYIALRLSGHDAVEFPEVALHAGCNASSLYRVIKRVLERSGFNIETTSKSMDFEKYLPFIACGQDQLEVQSPAMSNDEPAVVAVSS
ncbi:MAG: hypothetical protein ACFFCS_12215 [Candidatus Hodarchaeota archaeon]